MGRSILPTANTMKKSIAQTIAIILLALALCFADNL